MGGKGPVPKDPALRQRANKASTRARLQAKEHPPRRPSLPLREGAWHEMTIAWWRDLWKSPMAREYLRADVHGLYRLAVLVDRFWVAPDVSLAAQISNGEQKFGLSPLDRRRLEWIVDRVEKGKKVAKPWPTDGVDPREVLRAVK